MKWLRRLFGLDCLPADASDWERLEYAVSRLSLRDREIFLAHRLDDMSYPEIADVTGLSVPQVQRAIARALIAIDRELSPPRE